MAALAFMLLIIIVATYGGPVEHIHITNSGPGTTMYYAATVSGIANDHSLSHFEIRQADFSWIDCKIVGSIYKCTPDTVLSLPVSVRLTANGETITGYNKIMSFTDGKTFDFGTNFQTENMQIQNGEQGNIWHYAANINGITAGYTVHIFQIRKSNDEWFVCHDAGYEFACNVDTEIALPISVRVTANEKTLVAYDLITNFTEGLGYDFGANFEAITEETSTTTTTTTTTTDAAANKDKEGSSDGVVVIFVVAIVISLALGVAIGVFVYRKKQETKGYKQEKVELKERDEAADGKKAEMMKTTIEIGRNSEEEEHGINDKKDKDEDQNEDDEDEEDAEDKNINQP